MADRDGHNELLQLMRAAVPVMRELGVAQATIGGLTLVLGPAPREANLAKETPDVFAERRAYYQSLLMRVVSDEELVRLP